MRTIMAGLAEFERDLIRERVRSGHFLAERRLLRKPDFMVVIEGKSMNDLLLIS